MVFLIFKDAQVGGLLIIIIEGRTAHFESVMNYCSLSSLSNSIVTLHVHLKSISFSHVVHTSHARLGSQSIDASLN